MDRFFFRNFYLPLYRRWALWYIRRERIWQYRGLRLRIPPGVFHPGVFFSTPIFMDFLASVKLHGCKVLDMGTGSGALALLAADKGARVLAVDVSAPALHCAAANAEANQLALTLQQSNLFEDIPVQGFDYILVNPPYYARNPQNIAEHAFFAGLELEYFERFFQQAPAYVHPRTCVWMILSQDCNWDHIRKLAKSGGFESRIIWARKKWGERFFVADFFIVNTGTH